MDLAEEVVQELEDNIDKEAGVAEIVTEATEKENLTISAQGEAKDGKVKADMYLHLGALIDNMDTLTQTVANSMKLIGKTVKDFSDSVIKKLNCLSVENQGQSKIIEHKIQLSENYLVHKMERRFDENDERMKNMVGALATIMESQAAQTKAQESLTDLILDFLGDAKKGEGSELRRNEQKGSDGILARSINE
ncbi:hypothetical protein Dimus_033782 [Dionaea muscipula]